MAYKFISEMHIGRAKSARRWADRYYAIAKRAGEAGNLVQSLINRAKAIRLIHKKLKNGREVWVDSKGTLVYAKMPNGSVIKLKNKKIIYMRSKDNEFFYDDEGKLLKVKCKDGEEFLYEDGEIAKQIGPDGEELAVYDNGKLAFCKLDDGGSAWLKDGQVVKVKLSNGKEINCINKGEEK